MNSIGMRVALLLGVAGLAFGIGSTYERYRGTDLSRVPRMESAPTTGFALPDAVSPFPARALAAPAPARGPRPSKPAVVDGLELYPSIIKGARTPFDLWRYYGRGVSSFGSPVLPMRFDQWLSFHAKQKPELMKDVRAYMGGRYDFHERTVPGQFMSGGKPIMQGPVARLDSEVESFEALSALSAKEIRERDLFPYKPLAHPLQSVAHMVFPRSWVAAHPEHERIDVDMDIPEAYLPGVPAAAVPDDPQGAG